MPNKNDSDIIDWTEIDLPSDHDIDEDGDALSRQFLEALMRVTFAGFGGALIGLSHRKKMASTGTAIFQRSVKTMAGNKTKTPPSSTSSALMMSKQQRGKGETNYPLMWATSFMAFVSILETSRLLSPTTAIVNIVSAQSALTASSEIEESDENYASDSNTTTKTLKSDTSQQNRFERPYYATLTDYTLGGTVAGLAGSMSNRGPPASSSTSKLQLPSAILQGGRRSLVISGIATGFALGFIAGLGQTALDAADDYLQDDDDEKGTEQFEEKQQNLHVEQHSTEPDEPHDDESEREKQ